MGTSCPKEIYIFETTIFCTETYIKNKTITKYEIVSTETAVALSYIVFSNMFILIEPRYQKQDKRLKPCNLNREVRCTSVYLTTTEVSKFFEYSENIHFPFCLLILLVV